MKDPFTPKFFTLLRSGFEKQQILSDLMAGVVVGIVALPLSIAFAVASGVSPERGLITGILAGFLIALLGGSRVQIGGPTGAFVILIFEIVQLKGYQGLFYSTLLAGIILVFFGVLKLGKLLKFIPHSLIVGFTSGIALVIFTTQVKDALGLPLDKVPGEFFQKWQAYGGAFSDMNPAAPAVTAVTIGIVLLSGRVFKRIPGSFIAILLVSLVVRLLDIPVSTIGSLFGEIPRGISLTIPGFVHSDIPFYLQSGLVLALLGGIESLLSATVSDGMISGNHRSNTEMIAQGIANIVTPLFGGIPATGAIARTATNVKNGGRTPIAGMTHSVTLLCIMLFFGRFASYIPMPCLAGILIIVAYNMSEWRSFAAILRSNRNDRIVLLVTFILTVVVDLVAAIEIGIVLSSLLFMIRMSEFAEKRIDHIVDTDVIEDYSDLPSDLGIYEISGPLFFASARQYAEVVKEVGITNRAIIIRMRHVSFIDQTGQKALFDALRFLRKRGIKVLLSGLNHDVRETLEKSGILEILAEQDIYETFKDAVNSGRVSLLPPFH